MCSHFAPKVLENFYASRAHSSRQLRPVANMERLAERIAEVEERIQEWESMKEEFGEQLKAKLATMQAESSAELASVVMGARSEFDQLKGDLQTLYGGANSKFQEVQMTMGQLQQQVQQLQQQVQQGQHTHGQLPQTSSRFLNQFTTLVIALASLAVSILPRRRM